MATALSEKREHFRSASTLELIDREPDPPYVHNLGYTAKSCDAIFKSVTFCVSEYGGIKTSMIVLSFAKDKGVEAYLEKNKVRLPVEAFTDYRDGVYAGDFKNQKKIMNVILANCIFPEEERRKINPFVHRILEIAEKRK